MTAKFLGSSSAPIGQGRQGPRPIHDQGWDIEGLRILHFHAASGTPRCRGYARKQQLVPGGSPGP